jgi:predicted ATPase
VRVRSSVRVAVAGVRDFREKVRVDRCARLGQDSDIRQLELDGYGVVEEAATDIIAMEQARGVAEPWTHPSFIDSVTELQMRRQVRASCQPDEIQFHDRSVICTAALAVYLRYPVSDTLSRELERVEAEAIYQKRVFFLRNLGFISFEETLRFESIHEDTYRNFGFEIVFVEAGSVVERAAAIRRAAG